MSSKFSWIPCTTVKVGSDPGHSLEVDGAIANGSQAIVGMGAYIDDDCNFTTLALWVAPIESDGTLGEAVEQRFGSDPTHSLAASGQVGPQQVLVGVGMRAYETDLTTLVLYGRALDATTGRLSPDLSTYKFGTDPGAGLEASWSSRCSSPSPASGRAPRTAT